MVKRVANCPDNEPEQASFDLPSEKEHLFQVVDVYTAQDNPFRDGLPDDVVSVKCEVVGGEEEGRSILIRLSLDDQFKGFFAMRLFLKAIGEQHKGAIEIDTDRFIGRQFYATVVHNGKYANIDQYNFEKKVEQQYQSPVGNPDGVTKPQDISWEE